jgi:hypothetical protein
VSRSSTAALFLLAAIALGGCSGDDEGGGGSTPSSQVQTSTTSIGVGISREQAVEIAMDAVREDEADFDFTATYTVVVDEGAAWHVAFPRRASGSVGGEPHVVIDKGSGDVLQSYRIR